MKHIKLFIFLFIPFILTSCFQKKAYTLPLACGKYISEESFSFNNKVYDGMKLIVKEITKEEYLSSKEVNTLQDFSLPLEERKYYSINFFLLEDQNEIPVSMHFEKKCNPYATGPNLYIIKIDMPIDDKIDCYSANLRVVSKTSPVLTMYYLHMEIPPKEEINFQFTITDNVK